MHGDLLPAARRSSSRCTEIFFPLHGEREHGDGIDAPRQPTRIANYYLGGISQPHRPQTLNKNVGTKSNSISNSSPHLPKKKPSCVCARVVSETRVAEELPVVSKVLGSLFEWASCRPRQGRFSVRGLCAYIVPRHDNELSITRQRFRSSTLQYAGVQRDRRAPKLDTHR